MAFLFFCAPTTGFASGISFDASQSSLREGVAAYSKNAFDRAEHKFLEALSSRPDDPGIAYNLGNSYYKQGKFKEALQEYIQAAAGNSDRALKQKSIYNTGNTFFKLGKLEASATAYKKALQLDPTDMDAKFNLEFVRRQMQNNPQSGNSQQPNDSKDKGNASGKNPDKNASNGNPDSDKKPGPSGNPADSAKPFDERGNPVEQAQNPNVAPPGPTPAQGIPSQQSEQNGELSKQQAEQWLGSLDEDLKRFQRRKSELKAGGLAQPEKDW